MTGMNPVSGRELDEAREPACSCGNAHRWPFEMKTGLPRQKGSDSLIQERSVLIVSEVRSEAEASMCWPQPATLIGSDLGA